MRVILSAIGRTFVRSGLVAFATFGLGIWQAPDVVSAKAIAIAASYAAMAAGFRAIRVYVPGLSKAIADWAGVPLAYGEVVVVALTTVISGLIVGAIGFFEAPNFTAGKAAAIAAMLAAGDGLFRLVQAWLTPGEAPGDSGGIAVPPQPVAPASLPKPIAPS